MAQAQVASRVGTEGAMSNVLSVKNQSSTKVSSAKRRADESKESASKKGKKSSGDKGKKSRK